jgi:hypothetical protein
MWGGYINLFETVVSLCQASAFCGGIVVIDGDLMLRQVTVAGCWAFYGAGAVGMSGGTAELIDCTVLNCVAEEVRLAALFRFSRAGVLARPFRSLPSPGAVAIPTKRIGTTVSSCFITHTYMLYDLRYRTRCVSTQQLP